MTVTISAIIAVIIGGLIPVALRSLAALFEKKRRPAPVTMANSVAPSPTPPKAKKPVEPGKVTFTYYDYENSKNKTSEGWDINEKMMDIGAEELPGGYRYAFFPELSTRTRTHGMNYVARNAVAIVANASSVYDSKIFYGSVPKDGNVDQNFLIAAGEAYNDFRRWYDREEAARKAREEEEEKQRKIIEFATGKPQMLVLGEEQEYVED